MESAAAVKTDPVFFIAAVFFVRIYSLFSFVSLLPEFSFLQNSSLAPFVLASYPFFQAIGQIPFGVLSDRYTPLRVMRYGLMVFALATVGCIIAPNALLFLCARSIQGLCAIGAPAQSWLAMQSSSSKQLQSRYYLVGFAIVAGLLCGFISASCAQSLGNPVLIFWVTLCCVCLLIYQSYSFGPSHQESLNVKAEPLMYNLHITMIFIANATLHFLQSFILGGVHELCASFGGYSSAFVMSAGLVVSLFICASPLRLRDYHYSISYSVWLCIPVILLYPLYVCIPMAQELFAVISIVLIFALLLLLDAALPTGLKKETQGTGLLLGLYNTFQYGSMSIGSLLTAYAARGNLFFGVSALATTVLIGTLLQIRCYKYAERSL